jgi:hypothetical protein
MQDDLRDIAEQYSQHKWRVGGIQLLNICISAPFRKTSEAGYENVNDHRQKRNHSGIVDYLHFSKLRDGARSNVCGTWRQPDFSCVSSYFIAVTVESHAHTLNLWILPML